MTGTAKTTQTPVLTTRGIESSKLIERAAAMGAQIEVRDSGRGGVFGLVLRVTPAGRRTWSVQYVRKADRAKRRMTIGGFPEFSLEQARNKAREVRDAVARGEDPAQKMEPAKVYTFNDLVAAWRSNAPRKLKLSTMDGYERLLARNVTPSLGHLPAEVVKRTDVKRILDQLIQRNANIHANRCLALIRAIFNWGIRNELITGSNPAGNMDRPSKESPRDRVLTNDEIVTLWNALDTAPMMDGTKLAIKLSLVTGQRIGQVQSMAKAHIDRTGAPIWTAPAASTKNGKANRVPLSPMAIKLLDDAIALSGSSAWVFPTPRDPTAGARTDAPIIPTAATRAITRCRKQLGVAHWTIHDLRRTAASNMAQMGVPIGTISMVLDHTSVASSNVTSAIYIKHSFDREKRLALDAWSQQLSLILSGHVVDANAAYMVNSGHWANSVMFHSRQE
jgi:integrase